MGKSRSDIMYLAGIIESRQGVDVPKIRETDEGTGDIPFISSSGSDSDGTWTINKTYDELNALYLKGLKPGVQWHREDGSVVAMPLTGAGPVDGKDAFTFSVILTDDGGTMSHTFILNNEDVLTYIEAAIGGGGEGYPEMTVPEVNEMISKLGDL